ncbi:unnamed protein product [Effrenium voratum]|uniref:type I protein arginine methyltransferase n=1 Tax=Effrenium voratum TaxID=2562239 RepID=A0AA36MUA0_9DINO|nr:unnamed protein product [Effrenium voratum]CAJ1414097.1 unnamed protein product [Effrenium voratum]
MADFLAAAEACAKGCADPRQVAEALRELEAEPSGAKLGTWEELRVAEAKLRSYAMDELARAHHEHTTSPLSELAPDLLRPPWLQVPQRLLRHTAEDPMEVLCTLDCHPDLDDGFCWHCWHREECGGRPEEIQDLLSLARQLSRCASFSHRARLAEQQWSYYDHLCEELSQLRPGRLLVLGGLGVSAVHAARDLGCSVVLLAPPEHVPLLRQLMRDNAVDVSVAGDADGLDLPSFDACALEGFEPDAMLGLGVLETWRSLAPQLSAQVLPRCLRVSVALASQRLAEAAAVGVSLEPFAASHGGLAPLPQAVPEKPGAAALRPAPLSAFVPLLELPFRGPWPSDREGRAAQLAPFRAGTARADALLVTWELDFEQKVWSGQSVQPLPARLQALDGPVEVLGICTAQGICLEVPDLTLYATPPLPRVFLLDWYSEMLNDAVRNEAFATAIRKKACGARVADLGCGCGLLTRLALDAGARAAVGVEIAPHLARAAKRVAPEAEVTCGDIRAVAVSEEERFDLLVAELLDAGGLGEKIVPFMRHAKSRLATKGAQCVPRGLKVKALLLELHLPKLRKVDLGAWESYWLPASAEKGEWLGLDLDAAEWTPASSVVEVFSLNFEGPQSGLAEALQESARCLSRCPGASMPSPGGSKPTWASVKKAPATSPAPLLGSAAAEGPTGCKPSQASGRQGRWHLFRRACARTGCRSLGHPWRLWRPRFRRTWPCGETKALKRSSD